MPTIVPLPEDVLAPADGEPTGEISATFKEGTGHDACWLVFKASSAVELSNLIQRARQLGAFTDSRTLAAEFRAAPTSAQALANVQRSMGPVTEVPAAGSSAPASQPAEPPVQKPPPCSKEGCGAPTTYREGVGANGPYKGYFCTANRTHVDLIK